MLAHYSAIDINIHLMGTFSAVRLLFMLSVVTCYSDGSRCFLRHFVRISPPGMITLGAG